jgi:anti-sigma-K factor RskA
MDEIHDLTAGYALDALDAPEREAYEAHLAGCARCREELASFSEVAGALAVAAGGPAPDPALRERVLRAAREDGAQVVPLATRRRSPAVPVLSAVAAVAAVVALGLGIWGASVSGDLDDTRSALERERQAAAVLADPDARTVALASGSGRLVVGEDGAAVLVVGGLEPAPSGKTYQAWIVDAGTPASAGVFAAGSEATVVPLGGDVPDGAVVAVTVEQAGGADAPTTQPVVASRPV